MERNDLAAKLKRALQVIEEHGDVIRDLTARKDSLREELAVKKQERKELEQSHQRNVQVQVTEKNELYRRVVTLEDTIRAKEEEHAKLVKARAIDSGERLQEAAELAFQLKRLKKQQGDVKQASVRIAKLEDELASSEKINLSLTCELNRMKAALATERAEFEDKIVNQMYKKSELNARAEKLMQDLKVEERRRASAVKEHAVRSGEMIGQIETMKAKMRKLQRAEKPAQPQSDSNDELVQSLRAGLQQTRQELATAQAELKETKEFATSLERWLETTEKDQLKLAQMVNALEDQYVGEDKELSSESDHVSNAMQTEIARLERDLLQATQEYDRATQTAAKLRKERDNMSTKSAELKKKISLAEAKISNMFREQEQLVHSKEQLLDVQTTFSEAKKEMKQFKAQKEAKVQELVKAVKGLEQRLKEALSVNEFQAARLKQTYTLSTVASVVALLVLAFACVVGFYLNANA